MPGPPKLTDDLNALIELFRCHGVEFLVVGAHALAFHGRPRFTEDLDLFVNRTDANARRLRSALDEFGFGVTEEAAAQISSEERAMIVLGRKPHQVDVLNFLDGVDFDSAWARRVAGKLGEIEVDFLSFDDYVSTKRASGRPRDLDDLNRLREDVGRPLPGD